MTDLTDATVVAHSIWDEEPLMSFRCTLPAVVQFHLLRHRAFSFSFASMRAIPTKKIIEQVRANPFIPQEWPKNKSGMSADGITIPQGASEEASWWWEWACKQALENAWHMADLGVHKEIVNRLLAPFAYTTCIISATLPGLENFFSQRDHPDAQPEIRLLARKMREALEASTPVESQWHIPFCDPFTIQPWNLEGKMIRAISKCARVSYGRELEERSVDEDRALVVRLARDKHFSPFEHIAVAHDYIQCPTGWCERETNHSNFEAPWGQVRHHLKAYLPSIAEELGS